MHHEFVLQKLFITRKRKKHSPIALYIKVEGFLYGGILIYSVASDEATVSSLGLTSGSDSALIFTCSSYAF